MTVPDRLSNHCLSHLARLVEDDNSALDLVIDERYRIDRRLARGGMGEIFEAHDTRLDRPVALKIIARLRDSLIERFRQEARTMSRIEHPGIVPVHDLGTFPDGRLYYTMKFVRGRTLQDLIRDGADRRRLIQALIEACRIVHHAHRNEVIHRDLKPENIMVDDDGRVFVLDWGIARVRHEIRRAEEDGTIPAPGRTVEGTMLGTLQYMPPEQAIGELDKVGRWSDVFSLGAILYEILTRRPPKEGGPKEVMMSAMTGSLPVPPRSVDATIPADLESICMRALQPEPEDRYGSVEEFAEELDRYIGGEAVRAHPKTLGYRVRMSVRNRKMMLAAAVAVILAAVFIPAWLAERANAATRNEALRILEEVRPIIDQADGWSDKVDAALEKVDRAIELDPELAIAHLYRGRATNLQGRDAEASFRRCVELDPALAVGHVELARTLLLRQRLLLDWYEEPPPESLSAEIRRHAGGDKLMLALLDEDEEGVLELSRGSTDADVLWIRSLVLRGTERREALDEALRIRPNHPMALFYRGTKEDLERVTRFRPGFGEAWERLGRVTGSLSAFDEAIRLRPDRPRVWCGRAEARSGDHAAAVEDCNEALRIRPDFVPALLIRGAAFLALANHDRALEDFDRVLALRPNEIDAVVYRGAALSARGDWTDAVRVLDAAIKREPGNGRALLERARALEALSKFQEALADLNGAVKAMPQSPKARLARGHLLARLKRRTEALVDVDEAIRLIPKSIEARVLRAIVLDRMDRPADAIEEYGRILGIQPDHRDTLMARAALFERTLQWSKARADYAAARSGNNDIPAGKGLARCLFELRDREGAARVLTELLEALPGDPVLLSLRGRALTGLMKYDEALRDLTLAIKQGDRSPQAHLYRAEVWMKKNRMEEAIADANEAIMRAAKGDPIRAFAYEVRGVTYMKSGLHKEALADINTAIPIARKDRRSHLNYLRGSIRALMGDFKGARTDTTEALRLDPTYVPALYRRAAVLFRLSKDSDDAAGLLGQARIDLNNALKITRPGEAWHTLVTRLLREITP